MNNKILLSYFRKLIVGLNIYVSCLCTTINITCSDVYSNNYDQVFKDKLNQYSSLAKRITLKQIIDKNDIDILLNKVIEILDYIKINNLYTKFYNIEKLVFLYPKNSSINDWVFLNQFEEKVIRFTVSFFVIFTTLNLKYIKSIVSISPLEMVPLLKEMNVFTKFLTSNPRDYGHGTFSEKQGNIGKIYTTKEAIMRIMGALIDINLIKPSMGKVYKLSNITSAFYKEYKKNTNKTSSEIYDEVIKNLKRTVNNKNRIAIFLP